MVVDNWVDRISGWRVAISFRVGAQTQQPREFLLLAGSTGVGKTAYLHHLATSERALDLEGWHIMGSAFGAIGELNAPTQAHFENKLAVNTRVWYSNPNLDGV